MTPAGPTSGARFRGSRSTTGARSRTGWSTYLLAGLPVISDRRPGYYRYDEIARLGVNLDFVGGDSDGLRRSVEAEARSGERRANALRQRTAYSFDATVDALLTVLERARERYFARPHRERTRFTTRRLPPRPLQHQSGPPRPRAPPLASADAAIRRARRPAGRAPARHRAGASEPARRQTAGWKGRLLARRLRGMIEIPPEQPREPSR